MSSPRYRSNLFTLCLLIALSSTPMDAIEYAYVLDGVQDASLLRTLKKSSLVATSPKEDVASIKQLKNLATADCETFRKILVYNGFLSAYVRHEILHDDVPKVIFQIDAGHKYSCNKLFVTWLDKDDSNKIHAPSESDVLGFSPGSLAHGDVLTSFEQELQTSLQNKGFFQPIIREKKFIAHPETALLDVSLAVETGPLALFSSTDVLGNETVHNEFILSKLPWKTGDIYNLQQINDFETTLLKTGLFQSVVVECRREKSTDAASLQHIHTDIIVQEGKHKTAGGKLSYTTTLGAGVSLQLEHRNIRGVGERISFRSDLWQKMQTTALTYTFPLFANKRDNILLILEHDHQKYLPYHSSSWNASLLRDRIFANNLECTWGGRLEWLHSTKISSQRKYHLAKLPVQLKWSTANSLWDPTSGMTIQGKITPSYQYVMPSFSYLINSLTWSYYKSPYDHKATIATRLSLGTILGARTREIPAPDRFFGGTENSLRGYKTGTVSPLNRHREPIGGRSLLTGSLELRQRYQHGIGTVIFYDAGNVFSKSLPSLQFRRVLQSCGIGLRYITPIGPLRLDIAFPLKRRKGIDPLFQIYFSIWQAF